MPQIQGQIQTIKLYYLGGLAEEIEGKPRYMSSKGTSFLLPPIGEAIEVTPYTARDLMRRHKVAGPRGTFEAFTTDRSLAQQVKRGVSQGELALEQFTRDQLQAKLDELDALAAATDDEEPLFAQPSEDSGATMKVVKNKRGRPTGR
jgi:hypothetical protein